MPVLEIVAPDALVTLPPLKSPIASSTVPVIVPVFEIVPAPPLMLTPSSPPVIELVLVTEPPPAERRAIAAAGDRAVVGHIARCRRVM